MKRIILLVLDSLGVGALPDAARYGDENSNTLFHIMQTVQPSLPSLERLGLMHCIRQNQGPTIGAWGIMRERSAGKDTTTGHWEIAGLVQETPFPTFPHGFPPTFLHTFEQKIGRKTLGNITASGTQILDKLGAEHLASGHVIVYTSADSVFQIAAHEDIVPLHELYDICLTARGLLQGDLGVGRVIARPFTGQAGAFVRTVNRRDFSLKPSSPTLLDILAAHGYQTIGVGKIDDIFAGSGITRAIHTHGNPDCMQATLDAMQEDFAGLLFVNLVDFDMLYGHRRDPIGYAGALTELDAWLPSLFTRMQAEDLLLITADHGCDPTHTGSDHTREYVPLLAYGKNVHPVALGTRNSFADIAATILESYGLPHETTGESFLHMLYE